MEYQDQFGNHIAVAGLPKRIISVVPSQTELLSDLGLDNEVVGITKFCVHPKAWRTTKAIVGGTKNINLEIIDSLQPDLILANKEENTQADINALQKKYPVWLSDVGNFHDALQMINSVGDITGRKLQAANIIGEIETSFESLPSFQVKRTLYLIWRNPWMSIGIDTYIHDMMMKSGFRNIIAGSRYPELSEEAIRNLEPDIVLLSSEPFPFKQQHIGEIRQMLPSAKVFLVDGEMFSWYGTRMLNAPAYFKNIRFNIDASVQGASKSGRHHE